MDYQGPVGGVPEGGVPDPYDRYRIEGAQGQPSGGGPPEEEPPKNVKTFLAFLAKAIQKKIDAFFARIAGSSPMQSFAGKKTLQALKTSLEILKLEDRSQDIDFLNDLAENWNQALEESLEWNEEALALFKIFIKKISHYPENQPHTFGYYLTEHAGQRWVPFPYMELVQKIHNEHEKHPGSSALTEWTRLLNDTMRLMPGN